MERKMTEIEGDLIKYAKEGRFDVIAHGCNCLSTMGAGLAPQMAKAFYCDTYAMEGWGPTIEKLGNIDYETFVLGEKAMWSLLDADNKKCEPELTVVNAYTQYTLGFGAADYEAITLCMRKMNIIFKGKKIGLPKIGAGLAGGDWNIIRNIISTELKDCDVTIVIYNK